MRPGQAEPTGGKRKTKPLRSIPRNIDVRAVGVLVAEPGLKVRADGLLGTGDALNRFTEAAIEREDCNAMGRLEGIEDVFPGVIASSCFIALPCDPRKRLCSRIRRDQGRIHESR